MRTVFTRSLRLPLRWGRAGLLWCGRDVVTCLFRRRGSLTLSLFRLRRSGVRLALANVVKAGLALTPAEDYHDGE